MLKPPTGEPCAGEPHARFGGQGGCESFPTPIRDCGLIFIGKKYFAEFIKFEAAVKIWILES